MEKTEIAVHPLDVLQKKETAALLLKGENACREALDSLDSVIPLITDEALLSAVTAYRALYHSCADAFFHMTERGAQERGSRASAKASWLSTQVKLAFRSHTTELAALLFDGCHVMIRDLYAYLHGAKHADCESRRALHRLIGTAEDFREILKEFL